MKVQFYGNNSLLIPTRNGFNISIVLKLDEKDWAMRDSSDFAKKIVATWRGKGQPDVKTLYAVRMEESNVIHVYGDTDEL